MRTRSLLLVLLLAPLPAAGLEPKPPDTAGKPQMLREMAQRMIQCLRQRNVGLALEEMKHYVGLPNRYGDLTQGEFLQEERDLKMMGSFLGKAKGQKAVEALAAGAAKTPEDHYCLAMLLLVEGEPDKAKAEYESSGAWKARGLAKWELWKEFVVWEDERLKFVAEEEAKVKAAADREKAEIPRAKWLARPEIPDPYKGLFNATSMKVLEDGRLELFYDFTFQREYQDFLEKDGFNFSGHGIIENGAMKAQPVSRTLDSAYRQGLYLNALFDGGAPMEVEAVADGGMTGKFRPAPGEMRDTPDKWKPEGYDWWWNSGGFELTQAKGKGSSGKTAFRWVVADGAGSTFVDGQEVGGGKSKKDAFKKGEGGGGGRKGKKDGGGSACIGFGVQGQVSIESATFRGKLDPDWLARAKAHGKMPNVWGARMTMVFNSCTMEFWNAYKKSKPADLWKRLRAEQDW